MAGWCLLVIDSKSHLVNLDSKIVDIKNFGSFPSEFLKNQKKGVEFDIFGKKGKLLQHNLSDIQKKRMYDLWPSLLTRLSARSLASFEQMMVRCLPEFIYI